MYIGGHYHCIYNYDDLITAIHHTSKAGGNALQIFVGKNIATTTGQKAKLSTQEAKDIRSLLKKLNMVIFIHASLSLNLSNPLIGKYHWILDNLIYDLNFGNKIGAHGVVVHLGTKFADRYILKKYNNASVENEAVNNMVKSIKYVIDVTKKQPILIETSAGQRNKIATYVEELGDMYSKFQPKYKKRIGFCLDSCHLYSAGYDISTPFGFNNYIKLFNKYIGTKHIKLLHLNDSASAFNSHTDVHTNLMKGSIFKDKKTIQVIVKWAHKNNVPIILETRDLTQYKKEIKLVKSLAEKKN